MALSTNVRAIWLAFWLALVSSKTQAQSSFHGWLASSHEQAIAKKWKLLTDVQLRSAEKLQYLQTILLRPGLDYSFSKTFSAALGYAYLGSWEKEGAEKTFEKEHRIWQQVKMEMEPGRMELTNRLRLEQRFVESGPGYLFSQRLRYYIRAQLPLHREKEFSRGWFTALQNELFANIQNKANVNGRFFDQNRTYLSIGFRFSKAMDLEAGYLYRYQIEEQKMHHHIVQVLVSTSL